jgi:hypothetical protein
VNNSRRDSFVSLVPSHRSRVAEVLAVRISVPSFYHCSIPIRHCLRRQYVRTPEGTRLLAIPVTGLGLTRGSVHIFLEQWYSMWGTHNPRGTRRHLMMYKCGRNNSHISKGNYKQMVRDITTNFLFPNCRYHRVFLL